MVKGCVALAMAEKVDCSVDGKNWCLAGKCVGKQVCGNGVVEGTEECDDGNLSDGDGCGASCQFQMITDGLEVWFDASTLNLANGAQLTQWPDMSGKAKHANKSSATGPTFAQNGWLAKPGVVFSGAQSLDFPTVQVGDFTVLQVGKIGGGVSLGHAAQSSELGGYLYASGYVLYQYYPYTFVGWGVSAQESYMRIGIRETAKTLLTAYSNAVIETPTYFDGGNNAGATPTTAMRLSRIGKSGYAGNVPSHWLTGELNEIAVWSKPLSAKQVGYLRTYLAKKWSIPDLNQAYASCKAILTKFPNTPDGVYPIDPDGAGPIAAANLFCDMKNGGWTTVGNFYDSAGDDMPNDTSYVVSGWQQTGSGKWDAKASTVDRAWGGGTGSAAVSLAFVEALGKVAGQKNLKMCFVHKDGYDTTCRQSSDGSLTLVSYATGNAKLTVYKDDKLTYTFGRLAGLAGTADGYVYTQYVGNGGACIPRAVGVQNEFGDQSVLGMCEYNDAVSAEGVWNGWGTGVSYRPTHAADDELGNQNGANPSVNSYGFRLYIGP